VGSEGILMERGIILLVFFALLLPIQAAAHEVYVLPTNVTKVGLQIYSFDILERALSTSHDRTIIYTLLGSIIALIAIFTYLTHTRWAEHLSRNFQAVRPYAAFVIRIGFAISLIMGAMNHNLFGPEIAVNEASVGGYSMIFLHYGSFIQYASFFAGILILFGLFTRLAGLVGILIYILAFLDVGHYMINYINYFGEAVVMAVEGGGVLALDIILKKKRHYFREHFNRLYSRLEEWGSRYSFPIFRMTFGFALLYAAISVKFLHSIVTYNVVVTYNLNKGVIGPELFTLIFGILEVTIALMVIFGVLVREATIATAFVLTSSILYFGEIVWPHIILGALCIGIFLHGDDRLCISNWLYRGEKAAIGEIKKIENGILK
jgi:uncharacterized membrane protein YphA (DoxX/SURF4 family)